MNINSLFTAGFIFSLLLLTSCEDPSNVGLGLVGDEGGDPVVVNVPFTSFETNSEAGIRDNTGQVLVGMVDDPIIGQIQSTGYIDFQFNTNRPDAYRTGTVSAAILRLQLTYVYGDTLEEITLALHDALDEYIGIGSTQDSIPAVGPEITQFSFLPTASTVNAILPAEWIEANDATLRSDDFAAQLHGFQLVPVSGNAIVGFANVVTSISDLRSVVGTDTVNFGAVKSLSQFERTSDPQNIPDRIAIQNGLGPRLHVDFDINTLNEVAVNRANLRFPIDTLAFEPASSFVRPQVTDISLYGIDDDSVSLLLDVGSIDEDGFLDFNSESFRSVLQALVLGADPFIRYELRFPVTDGNTVNSLVLYDTSSTTMKPAFTVTTTPLN